MKKRIFVTIVLSVVLALATCMFVACGPKAPADPSGSQTEQGGTEQGGTEQGGTEQGGGSQEQDPSVHTHSMTFHPSVAETADTDGNIAYYECTSCGKYFRDIDGKEELSKDDIKLDACAHVSAVLHEGVRATADTDGEIDYYTCETCGGRFFDRACTRRLPDDDLVEAAHGGLQFEQNDDGLSYSVIGVGTCDKTEIAIPRYYCSLPVTRIGDSAFAGSAMTSLAIPETVTEIGSGAFAECMALTKVYITDLAAWCNIDFAVETGSAEGVSSIPFMSVIQASMMESGLPEMGHLYLNGVELKTVEIPTGINEIKPFVFVGCSVTSVTLPDTVTTIGMGAFAYCMDLESVTLPSGIASIEGNTFCYCVSLQNVTIPASVTRIGEAAFMSCMSLESITIPESVTSIVQGAFYECTGLTRVTIPESVTSIGDSAFYSCTGLTTVNWNAANCTIKSEAEYRNAVFGYCTQLSTVNIGENVESLPDYAFRYCESLTTVNWNATNCTEAGSSDSSGIFSDCTQLTTVSIGANVKSIPANAFRDCESLTEVHITDLAAWCNIDFGDEYANPLYVAKEKHLYKDGQELSGALEIPNGVTKIPAYTFYDCEKITSVTIPESVTSIGGYAFYNCTGLTAAHITDLAAWCNIDFGDSSANPLCYADHLYKDGTEIQDLEIPQGVTEIKDWAFYNCRGLTSVTIPDSATSIGYEAFAYCTGLESVTIDDGVTVIGGNAFCGCTGLTSVAIPDTVTRIVSGAFYKCTGLTSVTIGSGVTSIDQAAFLGCSGLTSAVFQNPSGWQVSLFYDVSSTESISVDDATLAAQYLRDTYVGYDWKRVG